MKYIDYAKNTIKVTEGTFQFNESIENISSELVKIINDDKKVIWVGNGGSASDCLHYSAELMGRFLIDRKPLKSISLTSDISAITAIGNDYGFENIFSRQVAGIGSKGDALFCLSTSGKSINVIEAAKKAKELGLTVFSISGNASFDLKNVSDFSIVVPSNEVNVIQEVYQIICSYICYRVEQDLFN
jgi:D-sedoheptulose 7-phosphate isomerase